MTYKTRTTLARILALALVIGISVGVYFLGDQAEKLKPYGYAGVFVIVLLSYATVILPAPGIAVVFAMGGSGFLHPAGIALAAGAGAALGELTGYLAGFSGQAVVARVKFYNQVTVLMQKYGSLPIVLLSVIPNPVFDIVGIAAGALKIPVLKFLFWCWIGETIKMLFLAYGGALSLGKWFCLMRGESMTDFNRIDQYLKTHLDESVAELSRLVAQPSVAAQNWGLHECAALVSEMLKARGFTVEVIATGGAPVVLGSRKGRSPKTLLFYNHYDVQPAEPLDLWDSPPFEPQVRDGMLFGRGVSDDKGHMISRLFAIDALLDADGELPCTVKFIVEGEEEVSSIHLKDFVRDHADKLTADGCIWEFGGVDHRETPMQYLGLRGICYVELSVTTAAMDVHSGTGGSIFPNAAWRLVWALASLKGPDERIRIPGFYDPIRPPSDRDRELMAALPETADDYKQRFGVDHFLNGLTGGVELRLAEVFEPTCTICGLTSGYQGPGSKTVLPAKASAKVDFRLVPDQTPAQVLKALRAHLDAEGFPDVTVAFLGGEQPARTDPDDPFIKLVTETAAPVYGQPMQLVPMVGGSGPNHPFIEYLHLPIASAGVGYPGTLAHAPNENMRLDLYIKGAQHIARILKAFGE